jgi:hypothetical protein
MKFMNLYIWVVVFVLTACGGGGGGAGSDGNDESAPTLRLSNQSLSFSGNLGESGQSKKVFASVSNTNKLTSDIYVITTLPEERFFDAIIVMNGTSTGYIDVGVSYPDALGIGIHTGSFELSVCTAVSADGKSCAKHIKGSPQKIDLVYTVGLPSITLGQSSITFDTKEGELPNTDPIFVSMTSLPHKYQYSNEFYDGLRYQINYQGSDTNWLEITTINTSTAEFAITKNLPIGVYRANVTISTTLEEFKPITVPVALNVVANTIVSEARQLNFNVEDQSSLDALTKTIDASTRSGDSLEWSITSNQEWIDIDFSPESGNQKSINVILNRKISMLKNGKYEARILINAGADHFEIPVTLDLDVVQFDYADSYFSYDGEAKKLKVFGERFGRIGNSSLLLNETQVLYTVINENELEIELPVLSVGAYELKSENSIVSYLSKVNHVVISEEEFDDQNIELDPFISNNRLIFEPVSKKIFYFDSQSMLRCYSYVNQGWVSVNIISEEEPVRGFYFSLSVDGKSILVVGPRSVLYRVDVDSLTVTKIEIKPSSNYSPYDNYNVFSMTDELVVFNSNESLVIANTRLGTTTGIKANTFGQFNIWREFRQLESSADRSRIEVGVYDGVNLQTLLIDKTTSEFTLVDVLPSYAISPDGSRLVRQGKVFDQSQNLIFDLPYESGLYEFAGANNLIYGGNGLNQLLTRYELPDIANGSVTATTVDVNFGIGFTLDSYVVSPSGNTIFSIDRDKLYIENVNN